MPKKHIVSVGAYHFAADSVTAATAAVAALAKLTQCDYEYGDGHKRVWKPIDPGYSLAARIELEMHQEFETPKPAKPKKPAALPAPKRGSILCICERSYVAPKQSCPHCGRPFSESHNRTHGADRTGTEQPKLRLI